jgi:hypothetical protein
VDGGLFNNLSAGRRGRRSSSPPQLGQTPFNCVSTQLTQKVHSKEQIRASTESGGKPMLQHSQLGLTVSMFRFFLKGRTVHH